MAQYLTFDKLCSNCGTVKPSSEFYADAGAVNGLKSECKACHNAWRQELYWRNPEEYREQQRRRSRDHARFGPTLTRSWKVCSSCRRLLPLTAFHADKTRPDGRRCECKDCWNKWQRERYARKRLEQQERHAEAQR